MTPETFYMLKGAACLALGFSIGLKFHKTSIYLMLPIVILASHLLSEAFDIFKP